MSIIDTPWRTSSKLTCLRGEGVETIIRYYSRHVGTSLPEKRLIAEEAEAVVASGMSLCAVYQWNARKADDFTFEAGVRDGEYARSYGANTIGQPEGSAIYFAVDYDASDDEVRDHVIPYFQGVKDAFQEDLPVQTYAIGCYGSWKVCSRLKEAEHVDFAWLAQAKGWGGKQGYKTYYESRAWDLAQEFPATKLCGLSVDLNETPSPGSPFGEFRQVGRRTLAPDAALYVVSATPGLNLRSGPDVKFDTIRLLPFGSRVEIVRQVGDWAYVSQGGRGIEGVVFRHFLDKV